ncbi:CoA transferase [Pseudarthrobacter sulfonivorans]|uniref:CaiB/BaiF CoA transferase family protein n=1 Tax=Pseudarthrobacter sulfonivorans TaxID=121292 RepID=UPI00168BEF7C|nr:CoA transferase [Pseudarthrobacter sulfonivorans]
MDAKYDPTADPSALPLSGFRIVDVSQIGAGPYCTSLLGDLGADVIKVEPTWGDSFRKIDDEMGEGESAYFFGVNRSKRSLGLDLRTSEGYEVLTELVRQADAFVVAFRPDAVTRMKIDYETLKKINPSLVYCSITAFGEDGPRAHQPGMDILGQALSGVMGLTGEQDGPPIKVGVPIADFVTAFQSGFAITAALLHKTRTGAGQKVSLNLLDGQVSTLANFVTHFDRTKIPFRPQGGGHSQIVPYQPFADVKGQYFILACLNDSFWPKIVTALGDDRLMDDKLTTNSSRVKHRHEVVAILTEIFATDLASQWIDRLEAAGVPCSPVHRMEDALEDPQVKHNGSIVELEHPDFGPYPVVNNPMRFHDLAVGPRGYAPRLGEHSRELLAEFGIPGKKIQQLIEAGTVVEFNREPATTQTEAGSCPFLAASAEVH